MTKVNSNAPCPCGSGKIYKTCCGQDNVIAFNSSLYVDELDQLLEHFNLFAMEQFEDELFGIVQACAGENINVQNEEEFRIYSQLLLPWALFTVPVKQNKTAFDVFYEKTDQTTLRPAVKRLFAKWKHARASVFEIILGENNVTLLDLASGDLFVVPRDPEQDYQQNDLALGVLLPYPETHEFFLSMIQLPARYTEPIIDLLDDKIPHDLTITDVFPQFLGDVLRLESQLQQQWQNPEHEYVARLFEQHANDKEYDQQLIQMTHVFWHDYCTLNHPNIRSAAGHAAALDYFAHMTFENDADVTQAQLATEYGTSPGTISTYYGRMVESLDALFEMTDNETDV